MKTSTILLIGLAALVGIVLLMQARSTVPGNNRTTTKPSSNLWDFLSNIGVAGIGKIGSSSAANSSPSSSSSSKSDEIIDHLDVQFTDDL